MKQFILSILFFLPISIMSQEEIPYYEIPEYPESYTAGTVAARMVDGLGFRFYWASEGLRKEDLMYKPSEDARTTLETLNHIYDLSLVVVNATLQKVNDSSVNKKEMSWEEKRKQTLINFKTAADILRNAEDISQFTLRFGKSEYPFWNNINGPIADAIWHCGQLVSMRRASGNPFNSKVSLFSGKLREGR